MWTCQFVLLFLSSPIQNLLWWLAFQITHSFVKGSNTSMLHLILQIAHKTMHMCALLVIQYIFYISFFGFVDFSENVQDLLSIRLVFL